VKAVVEAGKPVIVLLINGRPLSVNYIAEKVPAILEGWYLGEEGGAAFADVIFATRTRAANCPSRSRTPLARLPDFYNHKPSDDRSYEFSRVSRCSCLDRV